MNVVLHINDKPVTLEVVERKAQEIHFHLNGHSYRFFGQRLKDGGFLLEEEVMQGVWKRLTGGSAPGGKGTCRLHIGSLEVKISQPHLSAPIATEASALSPVAPMPGLVRQVLVEVSDHVTEGQPLVVVEAMKLQLTLSAGGDAIVEAVLVSEGELVTEGAQLVTLIPKKDK